MGKTFLEENHRNFYIPGVSPGDPKKEDKLRYCYTFFKILGTSSKRGDIGDVSLYAIFINLF
jgi:hypothetical protein